MPLLDRDGVHIHYEVVDGGEPTVLLSHGYSATGEMWAGQRGALGDHRLVTWDMRGHGRSDSPPDQAAYSEEATVADMAGILDGCGAGRAVIGGLSLGGYMSLAFAISHPERVQALMLFDTGPGYRNDEARAGWNDYAVRTAKRFEERGLDALGASAEVRASSHRSAAGLALAGRGMLVQADDRVITGMVGIAVPTLVLVGADDEPFINASRYMAAKIPNATLVEIPDAGHAANIDQPAAFNQAVSAFLAGL